MGDELCVAAHNMSPESSLTLLWNAQLLVAKPPKEDGDEAKTPFFRRHVAGTPVSPFTLTELSDEYRMPLWIPLEQFPPPDPPPASLPPAHKKANVSITNRLYGL